MDPTNEAYAGQAIYTRSVLNIYDIWVLGISNRWIWKSPTSHFLGHFNRHISANHLDIGVGTGYFPDKCSFPDKPRIALMDLNMNSLIRAAKRIKRYHPEIYLQNILEPVKVPIQLFDSISVNYLFHCLPGTFAEKAKTIDNIAALLHNGGCIFGSTILQGGVKRGYFARKLMNFYNNKGIFSNKNDTKQLLEENLRSRFDSYEIKIEGCVAFFWAKIN